MQAIAPVAIHGYRLTIPNRQGEKMQNLRPTKIPEGSYYTPAQVARLLNISTTRLVMLRQKGKIKGIRIGNQYIYSTIEVSKSKQIRKRTK